MLFGTPFNWVRKKLSIRCPASSSAMATIFTAGVSVFMVGDSKYRQPLAPLIFLCLYLLLSGQLPVSRNRFGGY